MSTQQGTPQAEQRAERDARIIALALAGMSVRAIADRIGLAKSAVARIIRRELGRKVAARDEDLAQLVALETDRLDRLQVTAWPAAMRGDNRATTAVLRIMERRARLLGLDAPTQTAVTGPGGDPLTIEILSALIPTMTPVAP